VTAGQQGQPVGVLQGKKINSNKKLYFFEKVWGAKKLKKNLTAELEMSKNAGGLSHLEGLKSFLRAILAARFCRLSFPSKLALEWANL
jgi:hypothetical protein